MTRVAQCEQRDDFVDQLAHDHFSWFARDLASAPRSPPVVRAASLRAFACRDVTEHQVLIRERLFHNPFQRPSVT
jgi:hypothetical protein